MSDAAIRHDRPRDGRVLIGGVLGLATGLALWAFGWASKYVSAQGPADMRQFVSPRERRASFEASDVVWFFASMLLWLACGYALGVCAVLLVQSRSFLESDAAAGWRRRVGAKSAGDVRFACAAIVFVFGTLAVVLAVFNAMRLFGR